jgi:hypothetical protein
MEFVNYLNQEFLTQRVHDIAPLQIIISEANKRVRAGIENKMRKQDK